MRCVYGAGGPPIPSPTNSATVRSNSQPSVVAATVRPVVTPTQADQTKPKVAALTGHVVPLGVLAIRVDDRHERATLSASLSLGSLETAAQIVAGRVAVVRLSARSSRRSWGAAARLLKAEKGFRTEHRFSIQNAFWGRTERVQHGR